jgi:hypothetical protein
MELEFHIISVRIQTLPKKYVSFQATAAGRMCQRKKYEFIVDYISEAGDPVPCLWKLISVFLLFNLFSIHIYFLFERKTNYIKNNSSYSFPFHAHNAFCSTQQHDMFKITSS